MITSKESKSQHQNNDKYEEYVSESIKDNDVENIREKFNVHLLSFKDPIGCPLYEQITERKKTVEGRKNSPVYQKIKVGDILLLSDRSKGILECEVIYVNLYADVEEYLAMEGIDKAFGNTIKCRNVSNIQEGTNIYREFVDEQQIIDLKKRFGHGFLGLGIKFLHEYKRYFEDLNEPWFSAICDGTKIAEGRLDKSWVTNLHPYDMIEFKRNPIPNEITSDIVPKIEVIVTNIKRYKSFSDLFDDVGLDKVLTGKKDYDEGIKVYRQWYSKEKEKELGVVGIFFKVIKK
jgi:ASC-1-like (ASCH) protein